MERVMNRGAPIKSTQAIFRRLENELESDSLTFYRGQSSHEFEILPSAVRKSPFDFSPFENKMFQDIIVSHPEDFISELSAFDKLVRMQHYGIPTRLLDVTFNPLVALYFCCDQISEKDGNFIQFKMPRDLVKYSDSDTVSCLANLSLLTHQEKVSMEQNILEYKENIDDFNRIHAIQRLIHYIKQEKGAFEPKIDPKDLRKIVFCYAKLNNPRIIHQQGAFLVFGIVESILKIKKDLGVEIIETRVSAKSKQKILRELKNLGIDKQSLFPSIENSAENIKGKYRTLV
jgi:FRG domain